MKAAPGLARKPRRQVAALAACVLGLCGLAAPARAEVTFLDAWGSYGSGDGQFAAPRGVAVGSAGEVYVGDTYNDRIQKFDRFGTFLTKWGSSGSGDGQFGGPRGVALGPAGEVYVADVSNHRIQKFDASGAFLTKWGSYGSGDGQFDLPYGVAVSPTGFVYVIDFNHRVQMFDSSGTFVTKWGSEGSGDGQLHSPWGVAVSAAGDVYVADTHNYRIQKFNSYGTFLTKWGSYGSGDGQFAKPYGVAVSPTGFVYVADFDSCRIQKFDSSGVFLTKWGSCGSGDGHFVQPAGVAVSATGVVYVCDMGTHRIQRFFDSDAWVSGANYFDNAGVGAGELLGASLTLDPTRGLTVSNTTTIQADGTLILEGGELSTVNLTGSGRFLFDSGALRLEGGEISLAGPLGIHGDGVLTGQGVVSSRVAGSPTAAIVAEGYFALGDASQLDGFNYAGTLTVGSHTITLSSAGFAGLGALTTLDGGMLEAPNGVALGVGDGLIGSGMVSAEVAAAIGSTIGATGALTLGDAASPEGFFSDGRLEVSDQVVTIHDLNLAVLGSLTTMGLPGLPWYFPGTLTAPNGALLEFGKSLDGFGTVNGAFVNHGDVYGGTDGQTLEFMDPVTGVGDFHNSVTFSGGYSPGLSPIEVDLDDVTFSATNTLSIELGGLAPGSGHDKLNISGAATLGGTLDISLINNFTPQVGDEFEIMTYASRTGEFADTTAWQFGGNKALVKVYGANALTLLATYQGDATLDFCVDGLDYVAWANNYFTGDTWQKGDFNDDGITDGLDYVIWANNYQTGCPGVPGAVPEPGALSLLALGLLGFRRRSRA